MGIRECSISCLNSSDDQVFVCSIQWLLSVFCLVVLAESWSESFHKDRTRSFQDPAISFGPCGGGVQMNAIGLSSCRGKIKNRMRARNGVRSFSFWLRRTLLETRINRSLMYIIPVLSFKRDNMPKEKTPRLKPAVILAGFSPPIYKWKCTVYSLYWTPWNLRGSFRFCRVSNVTYPYSFLIGRFGAPNLLFFFACGLHSITQAPLWNGK